MVGRLVEQEEVRLLEQESRQHRAHLPAARQLAQVAALVAVGEAEAGQDAERLVLGEELLEVDRALGQLRDPAGQVEERLLADPAVAGGGELRLAGGQLVVHLGAPRHARDHEVAQRAAALDRQVLRQVADADAAAPLDAAAIDGLLVGDDAEERGLARAVRPDEADAIRLGDPEGKAVHDDAPGEAERDVFQDQETHRK